MISAVVVYEHEEIELEKNDGSVNQEILLQPFEPICFVLGIFCWLFSAELSPMDFFGFISLQDFGILCVNLADLT